MMARVGRPTIGPGGKTRTLSTRITPDLRLRIENGAKASGRSMASEIEHRLEMSYRDTDWAEEIAAVVRKEVQALKRLLKERRGGGLYESVRESRRGG